MCHSFGPPSNLVLEDRPDPQLKPGHVIIAVKASALNFPDVLMIEGKYQSRPDFPFSPGGEFSGVIAAVADDVEQWSVGDEVFGGAGHGGFAEQISVPASSLRAKPGQMSFAQASGIQYYLRHILLCPQTTGPIYNLEKRYWYWALLEVLGSLP